MKKELSLSHNELKTLLTLGGVVNRYKTVISNRQSIKGLNVYSYKMYDGEEGFAVIKGLVSDGKTIEEAIEKHKQIFNN